MVQFELELASWTGEWNSSTSAAILTCTPCPFSHLDDRTASDCLLEGYHFDSAKNLWTTNPTSRILKLTGTEQNDQAYKKSLPSRSIQRMKLSASLRFFLSVFDYVCFIT
jgi:hypothetical protein